MIKASVPLPYTMISHGREMRVSAPLPFIGVNDPVRFFQSAVVKHYTVLTDHPLVDEFFGSSGFLNLGLWNETTDSPASASAHLAETLIGRLTRRGDALDVACGIGASTQLLAQCLNPERVIGININDAQLEQCRRRAPRCRFLKMSATRLEIEDDSIDDVLCIEAAFHFNTRLEFIKEAFRVLRPGGHLVLSDVLMKKWAARFGVRVPFANYVADIPAYRMLLEDVGFAPVVVDDVTDSVWSPFLTHLGAFAEKVKADGRMGFREWLYFRLLWATMRRGFRSYILVAATKPFAAQESAA